MKQANIPDAMVRQFSASVKAEIARWDAMTTAERAAHYDQQILETEQRIEELETKPVHPGRELHRQIALEMLNHDLESYRRSAKYFHGGGKTLKESLEAL